MKICILYVGNGKERMTDKGQGQDSLEARKSEWFRKSIKLSPIDFFNLA